MRAGMFQTYGDAGVLQVEQVPDPIAPPGWVVVELRAAALNWHDVLVRQGRYDSPLPHVPGSDGAGVVRGTGEEVVVLPSLFWGSDPSAPAAQWQILGDRIRGTHAELVAVPADCIAPKPVGWSFTEAAAVPLVGLTCYRALVTRGRLREGEHVLILGAGGGVATMATLLARSIGAQVVVTSSSTEKIARSTELGAGHGVLYTDPEWVEHARSLTPGGRGFDLVLDSVGTWTDSLRALRPGGRLVVLGASRADVAEIALRPFYFGQYDLLGTTMGSPEDFSGLLALIGSGRVPPPPIDREFGLDQIADAHRHLEAGAGFGKTVLVP